MDFPQSLGQEVSALVVPGDLGVELVQLVMVEDTEALVLGLHPDPQWPAMGLLQRYVAIIVSVNIFKHNAGHLLLNIFILSMICQILSLFARGAGMLDSTSNLLPTCSTNFESGLHVQKVIIC